MLVARCIQKVRNENGTIKAYILQDLNGNTMPVDGKQIKAAIRSGKANITNLQIDSAGRLVDKQEVKISNSSRLREAEILVRLLKDINNVGNQSYLDFHYNYTVIRDYDSSVEYKYLDRLEKIGLYAYDRRFNEKRINNLGRIYIHYCENNLKDIEFCYFHFEVEGHEYENLEEGYTLDEIDRMIDEEWKECNKVEAHVETIIKAYKKEYNMEIDYHNDSGYIRINGINFK